MFKVQISIKTLFLRIKAPVLARNVILINQKQLDVCGSAFLINGIAEFQGVSEFLISSQYPSITLQAVLELDQTKKLGGYIVIQLQTIEKDKINELVYPLHESPDKKAYYKLTVLYQNFQSIHFTRQLMSFQDFKLDQEFITLREKNKAILQENEIIKQEITHLKQKNQTIFTEQNKNKQQLQTLQLNYQQQISQYNPRLQRLAAQLKNTKMMSAKIMNLLDQYGQLSILDSIDTIMNQE